MFPLRRRAPFPLGDERIGRQSTDLASSPVETGFKLHHASALVLALLPLGLHRAAHLTIACRVGLAKLSDPAVLRWPVEPLLRVVAGESREFVGRVIYGLGEPFCPAGCDGFCFLEARSEHGRISEGGYAPPSRGYEPRILLLNDPDDGPFHRRI